MYKQSPSRSHRSKGIKIKHILQLCLLLAVCFWLIYQVKHSHQKKKEFDSKDGKVVGKMQKDADMLRFGRKDLPRVSEIATDAENHGEDEDEKELEEEENKHEDDELEKEDDKHEEGDGNGRSDGDDEFDENETERADTELEHDEESVDEDKGREENEGASEDNHPEGEDNEDVDIDHSENEENQNVENEDPTELEQNENVEGEDHDESNAVSEDQDRNGVHPNTHEAREEQYKADDASSEVTQDVNTIIPETGNLTTGNTSEPYDKIDLGQKNGTQTSEKDAPILQSVVHPREDMNNSASSFNVTVTEQKKYTVDLNKAEDNLLQNSTAGIRNDQPENKSNPTDVSGEHAAPLLPNGTQVEVASALTQNTTEHGGIGTSVNPNGLN